MVLVTPAVAAVRVLRSVAVLGIDPRTPVLSAPGARLPNVELLSVLAYKSVLASIAPSAVAQVASLRSGSPWLVLLAPPALWSPATLEVDNLANGFSEFFLSLSLITSSGWPNVRRYVSGVCCAFAKTADSSPASLSTASS